jgi:hypothetical protein
MHTAAHVTGSVTDEHGPSLEWCVVICICDLVSWICLTVLRQMNPANTVILYFHNFHFSIILASKPTSPKFLLHFRSQTIILRASSKESTEVRGPLQYFTAF